MKIRPLWARSAVLFSISLSATLCTCAHARGNSVKPAVASSADAPAIKVLSNRADLISGGDALVELILPANTDPGTVAVDAGGRDVSSSFALRPNGHVQGLLTGLPNQSTLMTMRLPDGEGAQITITNHPNGGPVTAGVQVLPWKCATGALDAQCNQPTTYAYFYKKAGGGGFVSYNPASPPDNVAMTTTDQGHTVSYVVRVETGHSDRGTYQIAVLFDSSAGWQPWSPQIGWNGKVITTNGANCGVQHGEGPSPSVLLDTGLSLGFAVMSSSLIDNNQNCNAAVQGEALMMLKEHFIEAYGPIRYNIGTGCSGGSISQQQVANAFPGLFDGIMPQCSFPDTVTTATEVEDCALLQEYWQVHHSGAIAWTGDQKTAVTGHPALTSCSSWMAIGFNGLEKPMLAHESFAQNCDIPIADAWSVVHPNGTRCTLVDYMIGEVGARPDGYARNPINNYGVQYGLQALRERQISPAQFVDLNSQIGSHDINYRFQSVRSDADLIAVATAYRAGAINEANVLPTTPMIDLRGHDAVDIHLDYHSFEMRARLDRANGGHGNQLIWLSPIMLAGDPSWPVESLRVMDEWLAAIEGDHRDVPLATKVIDDKPADATDRCYDLHGNVLGDLSACAGRIPPPSKNPRMVADAPLTNDVYRCQLKPLIAADYAPVKFNKKQWNTLRTAFPDGVCDYTQAGVEQVNTTPWQTFENGPGGVPLGPAPVSLPLSAAAVAADAQLH